MATKLLKKKPVKPLLEKILIEEDLPKPVALEKKLDIIELAKDALEIKAKIKDLQEQLKEVNEQLEASMSAGTKIKVVTGPYRGSITCCIGSSKLSWYKTEAAQAKKKEVEADMISKGFMGWGNSKDYLLYNLK